MADFCRVASRFGILVWYRLVFSRYFTNQYQRKTRSGRFGIVHLAGTPFFPQREASAPFLMDQAPLLTEKRSRQIYKKEFPQNFTKWSSRQILQYKNSEPNIPTGKCRYRNLLIPAKLPVNRWDATLDFCAFM